MVALFVAITFVLFIVIDILVLKAQRKKHPAFQTSLTAVFNKKSFNFPEKIFVSPGHTWAKVLQDGLVKIGIDDFAVKALGKISITDIAQKDTIIKRGDVILQAAFGRKKVAFRSPLEGIIKSVNSDIIGKLVTDPYNTNWGLVVAPSKGEENFKYLKTGDELVKWLKEEVTRLKDFLSSNMPKLELAGATMHDGGNIVEGAVSNINEEGIHDFEKEFLTF
ncbi:MAG: hypothetical protein NTX22_17890 [Ignavibacteriales bacterium]|nr:hypothetical protein [Ignavibacteriales bacterium]